MRRALGLRGDADHRDAVELLEDLARDVGDGPRVAHAGGRVGEEGVEPSRPRGVRGF